jgi:hypothetical protein
MRSELGEIRLNIQDTSKRLDEHEIKMSRRLDDMELSQDAVKMQNQYRRGFGISQIVTDVDTQPGQKGRNGRFKSRVEDPDKHHRKGHHQQQN